MNDQIKNCPWGHKVEIVETITDRFKDKRFPQSENQRIISYTIVCNQCCMNFGYGTNKEEVINRWNTRPVPREGGLDEGERKAVLEWAESFYENMKEAEKDKSAPKEIHLACGALRIIIKHFSTFIQHAQERGGVMSNQKIGTLGRLINNMRIDLQRLDSSQMDVQVNHYLVNAYYILEELNKEIERIKK